MPRSTWLRKTDSMLFALICACTFCFIFGILSHLKSPMLVVRHGIWDHVDSGTIWGGDRCGWVLPTSEGGAKALYRWCAETAVPWESKRRGNKRGQIMVRSVPSFIDSAQAWWEWKGLIQCCLAVDVMLRALVGSSSFGKVAADCLFDVSSPFLLPVESIFHLSITSTSHLQDSVESGFFPSLVERFC